MFLIPQTLCPFERYNLGLAPDPLSHGSLPVKKKKKVRIRHCDASMALAYTNVARCFDAGRASLRTARAFSLSGARDDCVAVVKSGRDKGLSPLALRFGFEVGEGSTEAMLAAPESLPGARCEVVCSFAYLAFGFGFEEMGMSGSWN